MVTGDAQSPGHQLQKGNIPGADFSSPVAHNPLEPVQAVKLRHYGGQIVQAIFPDDLGLFAVRHQPGAFYDFCHARLLEELARLATAPGF
jgi:hypothetical protein